MAQRAVLAVLGSEKNTYFLCIVQAKRGENCLSGVTRVMPFTAHSSFSVYPAKHFSYKAKTELRFLKFPEKILLASFFFFCIFFIKVLFFQKSTIPHQFFG